MKVWVLRAEEQWICDQLADEWQSNCPDISTSNRDQADVLWLLADWCWRSVPMSLLQAMKVVTTVHHIVPEKFDKAARMDFAARDAVTDLYHVYNARAEAFIRPLTKKPIRLIPYWANGERWKRTATRLEMRRRYHMPEDAYIVGSFQRDSEGHDLRLPKLEKGPDLLADFLIEKEKSTPNLYVVLAGWRRDYIVKRLESAGIVHTCFERPSQEVINDLYQTLDLYPVTARHEGGPQALLECGLLDVPVVSRPVGIAEQVLSATAIRDDVTLATPAVPNVEGMKLPAGIAPYREMFENLK